MDNVLNNLDNINLNTNIIPAQWEQKLLDDLLEQFRGKPKIAAFQRAIARQLGELYAFFYEIYTKQWINQAEGIQLDGIGNIVDLSRADALVWAAMAGQNVPMEDDLYRLYLWFKIFLNTSDGTYSDVARTLQKFWPDVKFFYSEHINIPATMFFTSEPMPMTTDFRIIRIATKVKAAGVSLHFIMQTEANLTADYHAAAVSVFQESYIIENPGLGGTAVMYDTAAVNVFDESYIFDNPAMGGTTVIYDSAAVNLYKEVMIL